MKSKVIVVDFTAKRKKKNNKNESLWTRFTNMFKNLFNTHSKYNKSSKDEKCYHKNIY